MRAMMKRLSAALLVAAASVAGLAAQDITGKDLLAVKDRLEHGLFLKWVEAEMGMTARTAQNFMQAAAHFGSKSEIVSHLPPTTLYKLASPSTPAHVRETVLRRLDAKEPLPVKEINLL